MVHTFPLWESCKWTKPIQSEDKNYENEINDESKKVNDLPSRFPINNTINHKIHLFYGDIYKIPADVYVVGQMESLNYRSEGIDALLVLGGPLLEGELDSFDTPLEPGEYAVSIMRDLAVVLRHMALKKVVISNPAVSMTGF